MIEYVMKEDRALAMDGQLQAGVCHFTQNNNVRTIDHTGVEDAYKGRGIAAVLVRMIAEDSAAKGIELQATCSYAQAQLAKHPEWLKDKAV